MEGVDINEGGSRADIEELLNRTRKFINAGVRDQALSHLLSAIAISRGPENVLSTLDEAKMREAQRAAESASLQKEHDLLMLAEATRTCRALCQSSSILKEHGVEDILRDAFEDGSSVVCTKCQALVKASRWEAHYNHWCPVLDDSGEDLKS